ncbi:hypothetical protein K8I28_08175 [bacterium]|nr:hypothetical protein [bacterium]
MGRTIQFTIDNNISTTTLGTLRYLPSHVSSPGASSLFYFCHLMILLFFVSASPLFAQESASEIQKQKRAEEIRARSLNRHQALQEDIPEPVIIKRSPTDDRGDYHGRGRDTGGAIRLLRAGEMREEQSGKGLHRIIEHDVKMIQDSLTIWCEEANYWPEIKMLRLKGDVLIIDPDRKLFADVVNYYEDSRKMLAQGNFKLIRDSATLTSNQGTYDEAEDMVTANVNMVLHDLERNITLTGTKGFWQVKKQNGYVPADPVLVKKDSTGKQLAQVISDSMRYDSEAGYAKATTNVQFWWEEVHGTCGEMYYYPDSEKALMLNAARILRGRDEAKGDSIWIYFTEEAIDSVEVFSNAVAFTPADSTEGAPRSKMTGQRVVMDFNDGKVTRLQSEVQAIGIYHVFDKGKDEGTNRVSGDRIILYFEDGKLEDISVKGGTEGTFYPPELTEEIRKNE